MKTPSEHFLSASFLAVLLGNLSLSAQNTTVIGGAAGDDTTDVPVNSWFRNDSPDAPQTNAQAFIGGIADTHDFIGVLSFDLSNLAGATAVSSVTIRLPQEGEIFDNRSGNLTTMTTSLTQLSVTPTSAATWNTYDGITPWTTPGGNDDTTGPSFTSNTFDLDLLFEDDAASAAIVIPTSPELEALILANVGGRVDFLWRVPIAEGGAFDAGRNFVVFDSAAGAIAGALDSSPQIVVISNVPTDDPNLTVLAEPENFNLETSAPPATTTLTIQNNGAFQTLTGTASVVGDGFSITSPLTVNITPGNTQDFVIQFDPSVVAPNLTVNAIVTLNTNNPSAAVIEFPLTGIATDGINIGSGGIDMATRGGDLTDSGITAYGWIRDDDSGRIAGGETAFMGTSNGSSMLRAYVGFDLTQFTAGDSVSSAVVSLWSQGATIYDANGGVQDIGETTLELRSLPPVIGFGDGFGNDALVNDLPANWDNLNELYGETALATATANLDTIAFADEVQFDVTDALNAAIANEDPQITFGIVAPGAEAGGARNFFAMGGMVEQGASAGSEIGPNLRITIGPSTPPQITSIQRQEAGNEVDIILTWDSRPNLTYALEETTDPSLDEWLEVTDNIESQGNQTTYRNTLTGDIPDKIFYRIRQIVN